MAALGFKDMRGGYTYSFGLNVGAYLIHLIENFVNSEPKCVMTIRPRPLDGRLCVQNRDFQDVWNDCRI